MKPLVVTLLLILLTEMASFSQNTDSITPNKIPAITESFDPAAATDTIVNSLSPAEKAISDRYFEGGYWHMLWAMLVEIIVAVVFLFFGLSKLIS